MTTLTRRLARRFYHDRPGWEDGTAEFHRLIAENVPPRSRILEVGSGPSNSTSRYLATLGELHGIDPDPDVRGNDALVTAEVLVGERYPYADASFDVCISDYVAEHVADAPRHLSEISRVLRPGGRYIFRTPNRFHYVAVVSALTPHWFHLLVANRLRALGGGAHDPYPTRYQLNTRTRVQRLAGRAGFEVEVLRMIEKEPSYGMVSPLLFFPFLAYERVVNSSERLAALRANIFAVLRKQGGRP